MTPLLTLGRDCRLRKLNQLNLFVVVACSASLMIMVMMYTIVSSYIEPFVVRCMGVGPRWVGYGLGWVSYLVGWIGLGSMKWTHGQH